MKNYHDIRENVCILKSQIYLQKIKKKVGFRCVCAQHAQIGTLCVRVRDVPVC